MSNSSDGIFFPDAGGGLRRLEVVSPRAAAEVFLHGAHVTRFQPHGQRPVLFVSERSAFAPDQPIRGGIPICFPWFGARTDGGPGPAHGYARLAEWNLVEARLAEDGLAQLSLHLPAAGPFGAWSVGAVSARLDVQIGEGLRLALRVRNEDAMPIRFEAALHTYLAVSDVRQVTVEGLAGARYEDRLAPDLDQVQGPEPLRITAETDRIYAPTQAACTVHDPGWNRRLVVEKTGSNATVVWNPWIAKAKAMPDFGDDEWPQMLCIETCNVRAQAVTLAPGQSHEMTATIRVET